MTTRLRVAPQAESQIREAADWWLANRPKAPQAFTQDLEKALGLISSLPRAGQRVRHSMMDGLRRVLMGRVRYYVYYRVDAETDRVEVLALWHASRKGQPRLG